MAAVNTLRAILVAGAALAAVFAAVYGQWITVAILAVGLVGHGLLWLRLHRDRSLRRVEHRNTGRLGG